MTTHPFAFTWTASCGGDGGEKVWLRVTMGPRTEFLPAIDLEARRSLTARFPLARAVDPLSNSAAAVIADFLTGGLP